MKYTEKERIINYTKKIIKHKIDLLLFASIILYNHNLPILELNTSKLNTSKLNTSKLNPSKLNTSKLNLYKIKKSRTKTGITKNRYNE